MRILVVGDSEEGASWLRDCLEPTGTIAELSFATDESRTRTLLGEGGRDAVVCMFEGSRAPRALAALKDREAGVDPELLIVADAFEDAAEAAQRLGASVCLRRQGFSHLGPALSRAAAESTRRAARAGSREFDAGQRLILEQVAAGRPLPELLERIVLLIESQSDGMLCSILLLDREAGRVRHGAAPHLPRALVEGIDGAKIGPREGSCGAAAYLGEPVIVEDIGTHPNWTAYRHLVLPAGLRACWSTPIQPVGGDVVGTFAMYCQEARGPTPAEREWVARATHLAAVAIARDRDERALLRADRRYRQIVDTAYEGVWLVDSDARTLFVNQRAAKMLGYEPSELLGQRIMDFMDEASRTAAVGNFLERLRTANESHEFRFQRKDGTYFWALMSGSAIRDEKGTAVGALGMITDISELKRTEEALRQSEAEFRVVFENATVGMALLDEDGRIVRSNPSFQEFLGYPMDELDGATLADVTHPADRDADRDFHRRLVGLERSSYRAERRFIRKDGAVTWGRWTASLVRPSPRTPLSVIVLLENVTDRRQLEEAVRSSERLRALMYASVTDVLFYLGVEPDQTYRFLSVNPAFLRTTGLKEGDVVGKTTSEVIPEPSRTMVHANYARAIRERRTVSWEEVTAYPAGKKYGEVMITPLFDGNGVCTSLVGTVRDVTERRHAEEEKRRLEAQLFHGQRLESLGLLAGGIAHDFNNLLAAILGNLAVAQSELGAEHPMAEALAEIERASQRGTALVRQLLTFSRRQEPSRKLTHLAPLVEDALGLLRATVSKRIRIETDFAEDTPEILADTTQIHQIVMNLGTNAAHAMRDRGGRLTVRVGRVVLPEDLVLRGDVLPRGSYARLVVSDDGAGIDPGALDRIFDPFFTTKPTGEGTGLGLSVVHGIVRSHEGGIAVVSSLGRGTEFTLYFPAAALADA